MVGYDPEDPVTALGFGRTPESYTKLLDRNALKGARIGVLRESIGLNSETGSDDFNFDLSSTAERNHELTPRSRMPIDEITGRCRAKLNPNSFLERPQIGMRLEVHFLDMRLSVRAAVQA